MISSVQTPWIGRPPQRKPRQMPVFRHRRRTSNQQVFDIPVSRLKHVIVGDMFLIKWQFGFRSNAVHNAEAVIDDLGSSNTMAPYDEIGRASCRERVCQYV